MPTETVPLEGRAPDDRTGKGAAPAARAGSAFSPARILWKLAPLLFGIALLVAWQLLVRGFAIPKFVLPAPSEIIETLVRDFPSLFKALLFTLRVTLTGYAFALVIGIGLALLMSASPLVNRILFPYAVVLQVTPLIAIAPLVMIWVGIQNTARAMIILSMLAAFFPILINALLGFKSYDRGLGDLFRLYGATRFQFFSQLQFRSALPYLLAGMKISGALALIGAVAAELVAGSGTSSGLAYVIFESGNRLNMARMFAAFAMLSITGVLIHSALSLLERVSLGSWHESAVQRD